MWQQHLDRERPQERRNGLVCSTQSFENVHAQLLAEWKEQISVFDRTVCTCHHFQFILLMVCSLTFILSLSTLVTAAVHRPDTLRGLSRWTLAFIMNVPNARFWKHTAPRHDDDGKDALDPYPDSSDTV